MNKRKQRTAIAWLKADAVRLARAGGKTLVPVTKQLDLSESALPPCV